MRNIPLVIMNVFESILKFSIFELVLKPLYALEPIAPYPLSVKFYFLTLPLATMVWHITKELKLPGLPGVQISNLGLFQNLLRLWTFTRSWLFFSTFLLILTMAAGKGKTISLFNPPNETRLSCFIVKTKCLFQEV